MVHSSKTDIEFRKSHYFPEHIRGIHKWNTRLCMYLWGAGSYSMYYDTHRVYRNGACVYIYASALVKYCASERNFKVVLMFVSWLLLPSMWKISPWEVHFYGVGGIKVGHLTFEVSLTTIFKFWKKNLKL